MRNMEVIVCGSEYFGYRKANFTHVVEGIILCGVAVITAENACKF